MTTKKGGAARPSLDIVNARSRCPREAWSSRPNPQGLASRSSPRPTPPGARLQPGAAGRWTRGLRRAPGARSPPYSTVTDLARFLGWSTSQPRRIATSRARSCSGTVAVMALKASRTLGTQMT